LTINVNPATVAANPPVDQLVGLRFTGINIPQGATVTSAVLTVTASSTNSADPIPAGGGTPIWRISAEAIDNSQDFTAAANNLSGRLKTAATVDWAVPAMEQNQAYASPELTSVVQQVISRPGWCGSNDLTILIDKAADGIRHIYSADGDSTLSPRLTLTYDPATATGCYEAVETAQITGNYDDAEQDGSSMNRTSNDLDIADKRVGLRFREIDIPKNATIVDAFIDFTADGNNSFGNPTVTISGQAADDPGAFTNSNNNISSRPTTSASVNWTTGDFSYNNVYTTPDLKTIVQEIVNRSGWAPDNAMVFTMTTSSPNRTRSVYSRDGNGQKAPRLRITYQSSGQQFKTVRESLIEIVDDLPSSDWTPIVETFYEASRYWRGEGVDYGAGRDGRSNTRISHIDSYTGGTVFYPAGCSDANLNSFNCINQAITGSPVYISPFSTDLSCQNNYQVLLTDGEANQNEAQTKIRNNYLGGTSCDTTKSDGSGVTSGEQCGIDLVRFMKENDQSSTLANDQTVTTYTVGFDLTSLPNAVQYLNDLADAGGGTFYEASSAASLVTAFTEILGEVKNDPTSFVAPSLATNSFNRLLSRDESYFGLFTPSLNIRWPGNVKKYRVCVDSSQGCTLGQILDANSNPAIDAITNRFLDSSRSIWTLPPLNDGAQTTQGGAGSILTDFTDRVIYSDLDSPTSGTSLDTTGRKLTSSNWNTVGLATMRNLVCPDPTDITAGSDCEKHMLWLLGKITDPNPTEDVSATTRWIMNDVLHSSPRIITYGGQDNFDSNGDPGTDGIIDTFFDKVIFGTNEGGLRMVNGTTGKEEWTFMPEAVLEAQRTLLTNGEGDHFYGMDVTPTIRIVDNNFNGVLETANGDLAHAYAAMRRGGNNIYALDVTADGSLSDPAVTPKFLWSIEGGVAPFERLGQTWAQPQLANIATTSGTKPVLVFGGGYDVALDDGFGTAPTGGNDNLGNAIYVVNAETGEKIFSVSGSGSGADITIPEMHYSIPSAVTVFDTNGDGIDDRIYVADTGGQVWRVDLANDVNLTGGSPEGSSVVGRLALISNHSTGPAVPADQRRFYEPPSVVQVKDTLFSDAAGGEYDYVLIGSGYRAHPLDLAVHDRFYAFRDLTIGTMNDSDNDNIANGYPKADGTPIGHVVPNELINITTQLLDSSETTHKQALGWFFDFNDAGTTGEKVLSAPVAIAGGVFFTTYEPSPDVTLDPCSANIGGGSAYNFNILSTKAFLDWDGDGTVSDFDDRKLTLGGGIPSSVVPIFTKEGVVGIVGIEGGAAQLGTLAGLPRYRTYWYEEN
jgi:type IV pilus assembly protein PilY1